MNILEIAVVILIAVFAIAGGEKVSYESWRLCCPL